MTAGKLYILFTFLLLSVSSFAVKDSCLKITESQWDKISKGKDYNETYDDFDVKEKGVTGVPQILPAPFAGAALIKVLFCVGPFPTVK